MTALTFLRKLKKNNNKAWFDENRALYETAKKEIEELVEAIISSFGKTEPAIAHLTPKDCLFRINRDVRFSKDKSPYKTNFGISITSGGKKSPLAGYYLHIEPDEGFVGGGLWMPGAPVLSAVRQEIDYNLDEFSVLLKASSFKKQYAALYTGKDVSLSRVPKGYEADNLAAEFLKLKSYLAMKKLDNKEMESPQFVKQVCEAFKALKPVIDFLNRAQL
ncbi:MAG: DUF2461 domain-containing protein [Sphingobacteriales bacterium]|jgi:uncharacterized protein (TIGR02453 family)